METILIAFFRKNKLKQDGVQRPHWRQKLFKLLPE